MANLSGNNVGSNYIGILNLGPTINQPVSTTLQPITDGDGTNSSLSISTTSISVNNKINVGNSSGDPGIFNDNPDYVNISVNPDTIVVSSTGYSTGSYASGGTPSAVFEMTSTTQGMLLPRMTTAQRDLIDSPKAGLMVYDTDVNKISYYDRTNWVYLAVEP
jgi:hypothetical protein